MLGIPPIRAESPLRTNSWLPGNQRLELPLELGELVAVPPDAAAERVERLLEPFALLGEELQ